MRTHNSRVQRWLEFLTAFDYTLECRNGSANGNADFLFYLPEPATEHDRSGSTSFNPVEDSGFHLMRSCGLRTPSWPIPGVDLSGLVPRTESTILDALVPRTESAALCGLPLTSTDLNDFRMQGPRIRIGSLIASPGRFVARVSASTASVEGCTDRWLISTATDADFRFGFGRVHRGLHGPRRNPGCSDDRRPAHSSIKKFYSGDGLRRNHRFDHVRLCLA